MGRGCQQQSCTDTHLEIHRSVNWCKHIYFIFLYKINKKRHVFLLHKDLDSDGQIIKQKYILKSVTNVIKLKGK